MSETTTSDGVPETRDLPTLADLVKVTEDPPEPERTSDNFVCQVGPCRHLWEMTTDAPVYDPYGGDPRMRISTCVRSPKEMDLTGRRVFSCGEWSPRPLARLRLALGGGR